MVDKHSNVLNYGDIITLESSTVSGWVSGGGFINNGLYLDEMVEEDEIAELTSVNGLDDNALLPPNVRDCCFCVHPKYQFAAAKAVKKAQANGID